MCVKRVFIDWMALDPEASVLTVAGEAHRRGPEKME